MKNNMERQLLAYFRDELDEGSRMEVEQWITTLPENLKTAQRAWYVNFAESMLAAGSEVDIEKELVLALKKVRKNQMRRLGRYAQKAAAILVVPLSAATILLGVKLGTDSKDYMEIKTNIGMVTTFKLPDDSQVWLNSGSGIRYPARFSRKNRRVELEGEAYFSVTKDAGTKFTVATLDGVEVEVLGTEFNVEAYSRDRFVSTTVAEGRVRLSYTGGGDQKHDLVICPGQRTMIDRQTMTALTRQADVETEVAWKDRRIIFNDTSLDNALRIVGKYFNVEFAISNPKFTEYSFTGSFSNSTLDQILEHFYISSKIHSRQLQPDIGSGPEPKTIIELY